METYTERRKILEKKYAKQIALIAETYGVDLSTAWEYFKMDVRGIKSYPAYNTDEARADIEGLLGRPHEEE